MEDNAKMTLVLEDLVKYISKNGVQRAIKPVFKTDDFALYNDDSLEVMSRFPDNYVDMIFADPPYMLSNDGFTCQNGRMVPVNKGKWDKSKGFDEDLAFHEAWISECRRVLKPEGTIWISGTYHSIYQCGFLLQKLNFHLLNDISWFKPNAAPNLSCRFFTASHETLLWARKDKKAKHYFDYEAMKNEDFPEDRIKKNNLGVTLPLQPHKANTQAGSGYSLQSFCPTKNASTANRIFATIPNAKYRLAA